MSGVLKINYRSKAYQQFLQNIQTQYINTGSVLLLNGMTKNSTSSIIGDIEIVSKKDIIDSSHHLKSHADLLTYFRNNEGHGVLLFDEADALFGKRTAVKDSHDRYANIETSYLLDQVKQHEGLTIIASRKPRSIDVYSVIKPDVLLQYSFWLSVVRRGMYFFNRS